MPTSSPSGESGSTAAGLVIGVLLTLLVGAGVVAADVVDVRVSDEEEAAETAPPEGEEPEPEPGLPSLDVFEAVYAEVSSGVVRLATTRCESEGGVTGSGALLAPDLVVTAAHVVSGHASVQLLLGDQSATGDVIGFAPESDLALVRASRPLTGHVFDVVDEPAGVGSEVAAIGYPLSGPLSMAGPGIVSAYGESTAYREWDDSRVEVSDLMRTTVPTNAGNSGGPIVDRDGDIVGLVSGTQRSQGEVDEQGDVVVDVVEGYKFAVTAQQVADLTERWRDDPERLEPRECEAPPDPAPLTLVTAQTEGPDTDDAVAVLFDYFDGINRSDYERAYRQLSSERRGRLTLERFIDEQETSYVTGVVVLGTRREGDNLRAVTTFTSYQEPQFGPDGLTCAFWVLDYEFVPEGEHGWSIAASAEVEGQPRFEPCSSAGP